jgi:hypothetical protein
MADRASLLGRRLFDRLIARWGDTREVKLPLGWRCVFHALICEISRTIFRDCPKSPRRF